MVCEAKKNDEHEDVTEPALLTAFDIWSEGLDWDFSDEEDESGQAKLPL